MTDKSIFIACPISKFFVAERKLDPNFYEFITSIRAHCLKHSSRVFLALDREKYGEALMSPEECVPLDFAAMREADAVVMFPEDSAGVAVELGWASALNKRLLVFLDDRYQHSPLIRAVDQICDATIVRYDHVNYRQSLANVLPRLDSFLRNKTWAPPAGSVHEELAAVGEV